MTAIQPPGRYGASYRRRRGAQLPGEAGRRRRRINGGYFVLDPSVIELIDGDQSSWEGEPLMRLAASGHLAAYHHGGFWQAMDTLRDKNQLEEQWAGGRPAWKVWQ